MALSFLSHLLAEPCQLALITCPELLPVDAQLFALQVLDFEGEEGLVEGLGEERGLPVEGRRRRTVFLMWVFWRLWRV